MIETEYVEKYTGKLCECGCGGKPRQQRSRFLPGHYSQTPEARAKLHEFGRLGYLASVKSRPTLSAAERLESKLAPPDAHGCRHFVGGARDKHGYGRIGDGNGGVMFAHRLAYQLAYGDDSVREGEIIHHLCAVFTKRSMSCCNPDHLIALSQTEHMQWHALLRADSADWGQRVRQGECRNGHSRAEHGFIHSKGKLDCQECQREAGRRANAKRRAARAEARIHRDLVEAKVAA